MRLAAAGPLRSRNASRRRRWAGKRHAGLRCLLRLRQQTAAPRRCLQPPTYGRLIHGRASPAALAAASTRGQRADLLHSGTARGFTEERCSCECHMLHHAEHRTGGVIPRGRPVLASTCGPPPARLLRPPMWRQRRRVWALEIGVARMLPGYRFGAALACCTVGCALPPCKPLQLLAGPPPRCASLPLRSGPAAA